MEIYSYIELYKKIIKIEGFATNTSGDYQSTLSGYDTRLTVNRKTNKRNVYRRIEE